MKTGTWYVYIIGCEDGSLYTGVAKDVRRRLWEHWARSPKCAKYTRTHRMKDLRGLWQMDDKVTAYRLEYAIKRLDKAHKDRLLENPERAALLLDNPATEIAPSDLGIDYMSAR